MEPLGRQYSALELFGELHVFRQGLLVREYARLIVLRGFNQQHVTHR
jgi:hypothetical protein